MMSYGQERIVSFLKQLSSSEPTPGGGSASALTGSIAAALIVMDCNLTIGKEAYSVVEDEVRNVKRKAEALMKRLLLLADRDARSFESVMKALSMPKKTELQRLKRFEKIQSALKHASEIPLEVMVHCSDLEKMANYMYENGNRSSRSDALVGGILATAALRGAYENLEINLESIKDEKFVEGMNRKVAELMRSPPQFTR